MLNLDEIISIAKGSVGAIIVAIVLYGGAWVQKILKQKQRNELNEIDLSAKRIDFEVHGKSIDDLIAMSNKSHGTDDVVKKPGNDDSKG